MKIPSNYLAIHNLLDSTKDDALAVPLAVLKVAFVVGPISIGFLALAVLQAIRPIAFVVGPISIGHLAFSVPLAISPCAFVDSATSKGFLAFSVPLVILPIAFIVLPTRPGVFALAFFLGCPGAELSNIAISVVVIYRVPHLVFLFFAFSNYF